ncbi:hypothetical protein BDQ12DRAFT_704482 [Crucibulum laeve]|uniref:PX domain-containing protein n=1 Tax=Crucibulum laeve TaxID=68775 RepID=A0A5C3M712_9AGAR|nr:hypothetical protein BDQ12DRAFT_704482 [Crucibulum laeve]
MTALRGMYKRHGQEVGVEQDQLGKAERDNKKSTGCGVDGHCDHCRIGKDLRFRTSSHFKRAIFRAAPSRFSVEFLPPTKQGGSYSYGMRICPTPHGDRASISSRGSTSEYEIWRKWEDCLWLQETLELEYKRAARERKQRLLQGKGVKTFEGFYKQDMASSWESLPPGPDPNSVAQDVHDLIPRLTKKGTIFRASQATIDQRQSEFSALIGTLFQEDMPSLIQEIRSARLVTDFFGYWRRDNDLAEKVRKMNSKTPHSSVTSSVFSMYFSASNPNLNETTTSPKKSSRSQPTSPSNRSTSSRLRVQGFGERPHSVASDLTESSRYPASTVSGGRRSSIDSNDVSTISSHIPRRARALSSASSDSSSTTHSDGSSDSSTSSSSPAIAEEFSFGFGHNPQHQSRHDERPASVLEVLPEEDIFAKPNPEYRSAHLRRRQQNTPGDRSSRANRTCQVYVSPVHSLNSESTEFTMNNSSRSVRESWQSTASNATILEGLELAIPNSPSHRASMASISTFMTTDSADAIMRSPSPTPTLNARAGSRTSVPVSLSDYDMWSDIDEGDSSILDEFPRPTSYIPAPPDSRPETPLGHFDSLRSKTPEPLLSLIPPSIPPSPTASMASTSFSVSAVSEASSTASNSSTLSIKAAHNNAIIMLRTSRDVTFMDMRQRLYKKFVGQEGIPLSQSFTIAFMLPAPPPSHTPQGRNRSASVSSVAERVLMKFISSQAEWEQLISSIDGSKLTLRVLDTPS